MNWMLETTAGAPSWSSTIMLVMMLVVIYAIIIIPQRRRSKNEEKMRAEVEIGDEIVTIGGIVGIVVGLKEDTILLETGNDKMRMRLLRGAISRNVTAEEKEKEAKAAKSAAKTAPKAEKQEKKDKDQ